MECSTSLPTRQAVRPGCLLCGRPAAFLGVCRPNDRPGRLLLYALCDGHPLGQATIDEVDDLITRHLSAERN